MSREAEREAIRRTVESLERTTGERPLGWYVRYGPSINTRELVVEEGGFVYDSMAYNDDIPYYMRVNGRKWLVVPLLAGGQRHALLARRHEQPGRLLRDPEEHLRHALHGREKRTRR